MSHNATLGRGIDRFYKTVCSRYLGIDRRRVAKFLKPQKWYNITRPNIQNPRYSLPTYERPKQAYGIDLIDMNKLNFPIIHNYRYMVNVVDLFSKYVFLGAITTKMELMNGLKQI